MTKKFQFDEEITNTEAFESALKKLLAATIQNGIDPRGTVVYRGNGSLDIEVLVIELSQPEEPDETDKV